MRLHEAIIEARGRADACNIAKKWLIEDQEASRAEMEIIQNKTRELERSNSLFMAVAERMPGWIVVFDRVNGERLYENRLAAQNLFISRFEPAMTEKLMELSSDIGEEESKKVEFSIGSDPAEQYFSVILYPIQWYGSDAVAAVILDIGTEREQRKELENMAFHDMLTGSYNRRHGMNTLNEWEESGEDFVICFIDLDRLKYVNDVFGHAEGDRYILAVSKLLEGFSEGSLVCRLGGDEFMVLAKDITKREAEDALERLRDKLIEERYYSEDGDVSYARSISYGIVSNEDRSLSVSELLSKADEGMYEYKRAHKLERLNRYQYLDMHND